MCRLIGHIKNKVTKRIENVFPFIYLITLQYMRMHTDNKVEAHVNEPMPKFLLLPRRMVNILHTPVNISHFEISIHYLRLFTCQIIQLWKIPIKWCFPSMVIAKGE